MLSLLLLPLLAHAADTTDLFLERQKQLSNTSFFCPIGRQPVASSLDALHILPGPHCYFNGPLDSVREPARLEPPFLDPTLSYAKLSALLAAKGIGLSEEGRFSVAGEGLRAQTVPFEQLKEVLFHLHAFPSVWGTQFLSIVADRPQGVDAFAAAFPGAFWKNPHFAQEQIALPWLERPNRTHTPLTLLSKCAPFGPLPKLLIVGDMHRGQDSSYFESVVGQYNFSFAALEITLDKQQSLDTFLAATTAEGEAAPLTDITDGYPRDVKDPFHSMLRMLKARHVPIVLMDRVREYFNFPYTDMSFHGLPIAARNYLWASRLPARWDKPAVLFAGRDHFLDLPSADFQDFALARFPGLEMKLVNPTESCP